jgi:hypothetical protein
MPTPSIHAQTLLADVLWESGWTVDHLSSVLRMRGQKQAAGALPAAVGGGSFALRNAVHHLAREGWIGAPLLDAVQAELPGVDRALFEEVRVTSGIAAAPHALVSADDLNRLADAAAAAGLADGLPYTLLAADLLAEPWRVVRERALSSPLPASQLAAWLSAANAVPAVPGEEPALVRLLTLALTHARVPAPLLDALARLRASGVAGGPPPALGDPGLESLVQKHGIVVGAAEFVARLTRAMSAVCLVRIAGTDLGTGFLVAPDLVLTNHHVLRGVIEGAMAPQDVRFHFEAVGSAAEVVAALPAGAWLIDSSPPTDTEAQQGGTPDITQPTDEARLDFALVRLGAPVDRPPLPPSEGPFGFATGTALVVLGYPQGTNGSTQRLQFAVESDSVLRTNPNGTRVRYRTNTLRGSSGSPVLTLSMQLVALHHYGWPWLYNQGVPTDVIARRPAVRVALSGV